MYFIFIDIYCFAFLKRIINGFMLNFAIMSLEYFNRTNIIFLKHHFFHIILVTCLWQVVVRYITKIFHVLALHCPQFYTCIYRG